MLDCVGDHVGVSLAVSVHVLDKLAENEIVDEPVRVTLELALIVADTETDALNEIEVVHVCVNDAVSVGVRVPDRVHDSVGVSEPVLLMELDSETVRVKVVLPTQITQTSSFHNEQSNSKTTTPAAANLRLTPFGTRCRWWNCCAMLMALRTSSYSKKQFQLWKLHAPSR